ncbi:YebC/PmpR family DNA-binding transcriptional regulator [Patescibacteria group bacterium]|nr:YebC/PmpR family DNA-binding transcriptional regulator [Patescibacteria group bacterium]MBU1895630.1 YebC/PmpR family DNA-binding transcriptional regulator [Patescibacteria group bacterium]
MSGHSRWSKIQHKKGATDAKRGNVFTKLCKAITISAQQGGGDPEMNFSLRLAIERAKQDNVPKDNIDRAIKRGTGELKDGADIQEVIYEGYGPGGVAVLIETITDNTNRTVGELKSVFGKHNGSLGGPGSVQWQFAHLGVIRLDESKKSKVESKKSDFELALIDVGAEDIIESQFGTEIRSPLENFQKILEVVKSFGIESADSGLEWIAKEEIAVEEGISQKMEALCEALLDLDDVKEVYTNEV